MCEAACGLVATVEAGRITALRPDPEHPISQGYACTKGTRFHERVQGARHRVLEPRWENRTVSWTEALGHIGGELRRLRRRYGPDAIGVYSGNAAGAQLGAVLGITALQRGLGTGKHYSCLTLDNSEQFVVAEAVFGNALAPFVADFAGSDQVLLIGTDPLSSQASQGQSHPRASAALRERARAGQLVVVDPRRSVTARAASEHLQPRVGTDVFLLAWLVREAVGGLPEPDCRALMEALVPFTTERVARVTQLRISDLRALRTPKRRRSARWCGVAWECSSDRTAPWVGGSPSRCRRRSGAWAERAAGATSLPRWIRRGGSGASAFGGWIRRCGVR